MASHCSFSMRNSSKVVRREANRLAIAQDSISCVLDIDQNFEEKLKEYEAINGRIRTLAEDIEWKMENESFGKRK